ncbi:MAG: FtsQ-type POTRA domain-containing protein [Desulfobacterales bacterium]|nr:FtsQ-type POTRA domain-containing protein [Desulfobacterales bacterium]
MLGRKPIKKNRYKIRSGKRYVKIIRSFFLCLKITAGFAGLVILSLIFILSYDFVTQCDYFKAKNVKVEGRVRLTLQEVIEQARIHTGTNILSANLTTARKRLLSHPWIAAAEVRRELPGSIYIRIKEHKPIAVVCLNQKFIINDQGKIFKKWEASDPENIPIINGLDITDIDIFGQSPGIVFNAVMDILKLGQKPESIVSIDSIKRIDVDREIGITIYAFEHSKAIKLGYNDYPSKFKQLKNVLFYLKKRSDFSDFDSIDLNNLNRVVINPI